MKQGKIGTGVVLWGLVISLSVVLCSPTPQNVTTDDSTTTPLPATDLVPKQEDSTEVLVLAPGLYLVKVKNDSGSEHCFQVPTANRQAQLGEKAAIFSTSLAKLIEATYPHKENV